VQKTVFDIGFHKGEDTAYYLWLGYKVIAFEANPVLVEAGKARFASQMAEGQLQFMQGILKPTAKPGEAAVFYMNTRNSEWGTSVPAWRDRNQNAYLSDSVEVTLPVVSLDAAVEQFGVPYYAKIDIEGMDREILAAFGRYDTRPEHISIESEIESWDGLMEELSLLRELGYTVFATRQQRGGHPNAVRMLPDGSRETFAFEASASGPFGQQLTAFHKDFGQSVEVHRRLFKSYAMWGSKSFLHRLVGRKPIAALQVLMARNLPGWYDTHASLSAGTCEAVALRRDALANSPN
jgi:FkbM family methyltransferase